MAELRNLFGPVHRARVMANLKKRTEKIDLTGQDFLKRSAVLVPFINNSETDDYGPSLLFTIRSRTLRSHRGQVSYPGGSVDSTDASVIDAALRETEEELGIPRENWDVWGDLPPIPDRIKGRSRYIISPVIATVNDLPLDKLQLQISEVDSVFTIPVSTLILPHNRRYTVFKGIPVQFPVYLGGPRPVWGITGFITEYVLRTLEIVQ